MQIRPSLLQGSGHDLAVVFSVRFWNQATCDYSMKETNTSPSKAWSWKYVTIMLQTSKPNKRCKSRSSAGTRVNAISRDSTPRWYTILGQELRAEMVNGNIMAIDDNNADSQYTNKLNDEE